MSAPRLASIPFEHVEAELAAFPLASEASFRFCIQSIDPRIEQNPRLWREAEKDILRVLPSIAPDEVATIRDQLWFNSSRLGDPSLTDETFFRPVSLGDYLRGLAESYLDEMGTPFEAGGLPPPEGGPNARLRWNWMCQALPPDLLRVARGVEAPADDCFSLTPDVEKRILDRGYAETHAHQGAVLDFSLLWAGLMRGLTESSAGARDFESPGASFSDGKRLAFWLLHAAAARLLLAQWLFKHPNQPLTDFNLRTVSNSIELDAVEHIRLIQTLWRLRLGQDRGSAREPSTFGTRVENLEIRFRRVQAIYRRLVRPAAQMRDRRNRHRIQNRLDVFGRDPIAEIVGWNPTEAESPETLFLAEALRRIAREKAGPNQDPQASDFARIFWQILRVRCLLYRHVVLRPMTPGLPWFVRFYDRIGALKKHIPLAVQFETVAHLYGRKPGLRSLELRLGTHESQSKCVEKIRNLESRVKKRGGSEAFRFFFRLRPNDSDEPQGAGIEVGGVFHFCRDRGGGWMKGNLNAFSFDRSYPGIDPQTRNARGKKKIPETLNRTGFRFARFYLEQRRHAQTLVSLLGKYPAALQTFRGIDLCTDEAGVPIWVMAPLFKWVRDAGNRASTVLKRRGNLCLPPLRATVHAGEDFIHLLTGLRRIDETVVYLGLVEGDRLGHALALGIDPEDRCGRTGRTVQSREERLFDLIWEWRCYASGNITFSNGARLAFVRRQLIGIAKEIFDLSCTPEDLMAFVDNLHDGHHLERLGFPDQPERSARESSWESSNSDKLLRKYLRDSSVWRRGRLPIVTDFRNLLHETESLVVLQRALRNKIARGCLTIEVNPTSNLLIGALENFHDNPFFQLGERDSKGEGLHLTVCIGSDDPLIFATNLPNEYQLLFDAMIQRGDSKETALQWIEAARTAGMGARFTLPWPAGMDRGGIWRPNLLAWQPPQSPP